MDHDKEKSRKWKLAKILVGLSTGLYLLVLTVVTALLLAEAVPAAVWQNAALWGFGSWSASVIGVGTGYGFANVAQHGVYQFAQVRNGEGDG